MQCTPRGKHFQLLHRSRPKQKVKRPPKNYKSQQETNSPSDTSKSFFFFCLWRGLEITRRLQAFPPRGGKAAPVTLLRDPSPTRPTPVKLEPRPSPASLSLLPNPDPCHPPPGAPRWWGTQEHPPLARRRPPAETRPRLDAGAPARTHSRGALL